MNQARKSLLGMTTLSLCGVFVSTIIAWAFFASTPSKTERPPSPLIERGRKLFLKQGCWYCHHPELKGHRWASGLKRPLSQDWMLAYLRSPRSVNPHTSMQSYRWLVYGKDAGRNTRALVGYLNSLLPEKSKGGWTLRERSHGEPAEFDLREGRRLYGRNCSGCHGLRGEGSVTAQTRLQMAIPKLTEPSKFLCRSGSQMSVDDLRRTLDNGMSHGVMIAWKKRLTSHQMRSLVEYVRQLAPHGYVASSPKLNLKALKLPERRKLSRPQFRGWLRHWWSVGFAQWRHEQKSRGQEPWMSQVDWERWVRWQRFAQWVKADPRRLSVSEADWRVSQYQRLKLRFPTGVKAWEQTGKHTPLHKWLRGWWYRKLSGHAGGEPWRCSLPHWVRRRFPAKWRARCLNEIQYKVDSKMRQADFLKYDPWRSRIEQKAFHNWKENQNRLMFQAWEGSKVYRALNCASCHGSDGSGKEITLQGLHVAWHKRAMREVKDWKKKKRLKIRSFEEGRFRCGATPLDLARTIHSYLTGKGPHLGISEGQLRRQLGHYPPLWSRHNIKDLDKKTMQLVTYIRFLARELPLSRAIKTEPTLPFQKAP